MKIALTGASGFVGKALQRQFPHYVVIERKDDEVTILRKLEGVDVAINLAGAPIIKRWSEAYKKVLLSSRIETTKKLVSALNKSDVPHFISTSAIGIYPDDIACDESTTEIADDFLGILASQWEAEAFKCEKETTILRFSIILGKDGGALAQMLTPFNAGVGGIIGDGKMMTSWITLNDLMRLYHFVIEEKLTGVINAAAPNPIRNHSFTKALGKALNRPTFLPLPTFVLKLIFGEASTVLTGSKEVYPKRLHEAGFVFDHPTIESALAHILD